MTSEASSGKRSPHEGPSPDASIDAVLLTVGRIVAAHGIRGEVKLVLTTDRPEKMNDIRRVYLDGSEMPTRVTSFRLHGNDREAIVKFQGINDRDTAEQLRGVRVQIRGNQLPPPEEGAFFHYQIIGLQAVTESGDDLGTVSEIIDAGEVDVYVVTDDQKRQHLFPALRDVVLDINPAEGRMIIRPQRYIDDE